MDHRIRVRDAALVAVLVTAGAPAAHADRWLSAELPAAWAISEPQSNTFRPGALPALGFYQSLTRWAALGLRVRAGALGDGASPPDGLRDPGYAGLGTLVFAARVNAGGWWMEVAGGGGMTGRDLVPTFEIGAGVTQPLGGLEIGPSVRLLHVDAPDMALGLGPADLALVGIEVRRARTPARPRRTRAAARVAATMPEAPMEVPMEPPAATARDGDRLVDELASCRALAAVIDGGTPGDGCAVEGDIVVHADRIVLSELVLFDLNRARVRRHARPVLDAIARAWGEQKGWDKLIIEGHCDVRGPDDFNVWLSQERAQRTRAALIEAGVPADRIEAIGFGTERPRDPGTDEAANARNRRVEFVIVPHGGSR